MPRKRQPQDDNRGRGAAPHTDSADTARAKKAAAQRPAPHADSAQTAREKKAVREIKRRQRILKAAGYSIVVDGIWGKRSQLAWKQYKKGNLPAGPQDPSVYYFTLDTDGKKPKARKVMRPDADDANTAAAERIRQDKEIARQAHLQDVRQRKQRLEKLHTIGAKAVKDPKSVRNIPFHQLLGVLKANPDKFDFSKGKGSAYLTVQNWLQAHGYKVRVTGQYDRLTLDALRTAEEKARENARREKLQAARDFYKEWNLKAGQRSKFFDPIGGKVPTPADFAKYILTDNTFTGKLVLDNIAHMIDGGDAAAWDFGTRSTAIERLKADEYPFGMLSFYVNAFGVSEAARRFTDAEILMSVLNRNAGDPILSQGKYDPNSDIQRVADFAATQKRNTEFKALLRSQNMDHLKRMVIQHAIVDDQIIRRYNANIAAQKPWWVDGLEALAAPAEWSVTAGVLAIDKAWAAAFGGPDVQWEDAMIQAGLEPDWYTGDMRSDALGGSLTQFAALLIVDPLNFVAPVKYTAMGVRGAKGIGNATSGLLGSSYRFAPTAAGRYRVIAPRKHTALRRIQKYNTGKSILTKEVKWQRGQWRLTDALRGLPYAAELEADPWVMSLKQKAKLFTRQKNESLENAGRNTVAQMRNFFKGDGIRYKDAPTFRPLTGNLQKKMDQAFMGAEKAAVIMHQMERMLDEGAEYGISFAESDMGMAVPSSVGASAGAALSAVYEAHIKTALAARAAKEHLDKAGYWPLRDRYMKMTKGDRKREVIPQEFSAEFRELIEQQNLTMDKNLSKEARQKEKMRRLREIIGQYDAEGEVITPGKPTGQPAHGEEATRYLLFEIEKEAAAEFQRVHGTADVSILGGAGADDALNDFIRGEVQRFNMFVWDTLLPHMQHRLKAKAAAKGIELFDNEGRWIHRNDSEVANKLRSLARESFEKEVRIKNPSFGKGFTRKQMHERIRWETSTKFRRAEFYMQRAKVGLHNVDDKALRESVEKEVAEVEQSWYQRADTGEWHDSREWIEVSDLYARHYAVMRDGVEKARTRKAWAGDWFATMAENPEVASGLMGDLWLGHIVHAWSSYRFSQGALKGLPSKYGGGTPGVISHIPDDVRLRQYNPQDPDFGYGAARGEFDEAGRAEAEAIEAGYKAWAGAMDELHRTQLLAADRVNLTEVWKQGAAWQALAQHRAGWQRYMYQAATSMMRIWQTAVLPLRLGWVTRNSVDNFIKAMISGAYDPRLYWSGAVKPGEGTRRFFSDQAQTVGEGFDFLTKVFTGGKVENFEGLGSLAIDALRATVRVLDAQFGTSVDNIIQQLMEESIWNLPDEQVKQLFKAEGLPMDDGMLAHIRMELREKAVRRNPLENMLDELENQANWWHFYFKTELPDSIIQRIFGKYGHIETPEQKIRDARHIGFKSRANRNPTPEDIESWDIEARALNATGQESDAAKSLTPRQRKAYNDGYHKSRDRDLDQWYDGTSPLRVEIEGLRAVDEEIGLLRKQADELRSRESMLETRKQVPEYKALSDYEGLGLRMKRRRRAKGKVNAHAHDLLAESGGEITPQIQKLLDEVTEIQAELDRLKELRAAIREKPEIVDFYNQLKITREQLRQTEGRIKELEKQFDLKGLPDKKDAEIPPWDRIDARAKEAGWAAVKNLGARTKTLDGISEFSDQIWQLMGERPEAYFRRIIYRSEYAKQMDSWRTYIVSVDREMAELRGRLEQEEMNYKDSLQNIDRQRDVIEKAKEAVALLRKKHASKIAFEIHPFYANPADPSQFHIGVASQFVMDEKDIAQAAGRSVGADLRSFRSLHKDKVAAGYDRVRGYIVTRNGEVIDVRVTKIENPEELANISTDVRYPEGGSMDVELRTDRIGGLGPDFELAPRNKPGEKHLDKGHKFETKRRKFKGGKLDARRISNTVRSRIKHDFKDDPRFSTKLWKRPDHTGIAPIVERDLVEQEALDSAANAQADTVTRLHQDIARLTADASDIHALLFDIADWPTLPWKRGEVTRMILNEDFRKAQEFFSKMARDVEDVAGIAQRILDGTWDGLDRVPVTRYEQIVSNGSWDEVADLADDMKRVLEDFVTVRNMESDRRVLLMEAEAKLETESAKLAEMTGLIERNEKAEAKILERRAAYIQRLYATFADEKITKAEANLLVQNDAIAELKAKAAAIQGINMRRQKKITQFFQERGLQSHAQIEIAAHNSAWKLVEDTLFDYDAITNIEDNLRFLFPFIQFWRKNTAFWIKTFAKHPGVPAAIAKTEEQFDKWNADVPPAMRRYLRLSKVIPYLPDGLQEVAENLGLQDFGFDPLNMTSLAPLWRQMKGNNPLLRDEDMGKAFFSPAVSAMNDIGLGFAPWAYEPMEWLGWVDQRSWMTVFPQQSLLTAFTRTFYNDLDKKLMEMDHGWERVAGYILTGTDPKEIAENFDYWVNVEMVGQAERGQPISRAEAEEVMRAVFYLQNVSTYFAGMWLRRMNASDIHIANLLDELREDENAALNDEEWRVVRLWGKRGYSRDKFDEYVSLLPKIETYFKLADFDESEEWLQENPEIAPYVRRKGSKAYSPARWESTLNMQNKVDNARFWNMAEQMDKLHADEGLTFDVMSTFVTEDLKKWWEANDTPEEQRNAMAKALQNAYYQGLTNQFFAIPDTDYEAKQAFIEKHPAIQIAWWRNNDKADDFKDTWNTANAALRETYFELVNSGDGENWDAAAPFLKEFPFMFEGTRSAGKINPNTGEWKAKTEKGRAYRKVKAEMTWFFKEYLPKVGEKEAFNWLFSQPDDPRATAILDYLKKYGKNSEKIIDLLKVWHLLQYYFSLDKKARGEWLRSGGAGPAAVLAYFKKYGSSKGQSQHAKDYLAIKGLLDRYFGMSKKARKEWLNAGSPEAQRVLDYFKKYGKKHQQERGFRANQFLANHPDLKWASPELRLRLMFWQQYFNLPPDQREEFVFNNAEKFGVFIYGEWGEQEISDQEAAYYRKAVGAGASKRMADYLYVAPLLEFYYDLKDSFEKNLFLRMNPELQQYLDKYSDRELTKDKALNAKLERYFSFPYGSSLRDKFAQENPEVQQWLRGQGSPADQAMYAILDKYFSLPKGEARRSYIGLHPELQEWFDRAKDERDRRNDVFDSFDTVDPRLKPLYDQTQTYEEWAKLTRAKLRRRMLEQLLGEDVASSRERRPLAQRR